MLYSYPQQQGTRAGRASAARPTSGAPSRGRESQAVPALPNRNYTIPKPDRNDPSTVSGRPLPKRPDEAYQRLLQNQVLDYYYLSLILFSKVQITKHIHFNHIPVHYFIFSEFQTVQ